MTWAWKHSASMSTRGLCAEDVVMERSLSFRESCCSSVEPTSVDVERMAGDVARPVRPKEKDRSSHIDGLTHPAETGYRMNGGRALLRLADPQHRRVHRAWDHRVDADPMRRVQPCKPVHETQHGCLRSAIHRCAFATAGHACR